MRNLLLFLTVLFILLFVRSEFMWKKKTLETELRGNYQRQILESLELERELLSFDLHDTILQKLGFIKQRLEDDHSGCPKEKLINDLATDAIGDIRLLCRSLHRLDEGVSFIDQLSTLFADFKNVSAISLETLTFGLEDVVMDASKKHHLVRIIQELLNNGQKHSGARKMQLHVYSIPPILRIMYRDDGIKTIEGIPLTLKSIEFRCNILSAGITKSNAPGGGLALQIEVPLEIDTGRG